MIVSLVKLQAEFAPILTAAGSERMTPAALRAAIGALADYVPATALVNRLCGCVHRMLVLATQFFPPEDAVKVGIQGVG